MIRVSGHSKNSPVKAAGVESCGQRRNQKLHAAVARSTFSNIFKSKGAKHVTFGAFFEVLMRKNCTSLWCEAHFEQNTSALEHVLKL